MVTHLRSFPRKREPVAGSPRTFAGTSGTRSSVRKACRQALRFGDVVRRVDIKERVDRRDGPVRNCDSVSRAPFADFARAFLGERAPQVLAQGRGPERDDRMAAPARSR